MSTLGWLLDFDRFAWRKFKNTQITSITQSLCMPEAILLGEVNFDLLLQQVILYWHKQLHHWKEQRKKLPWKIREILIFYPIFLLFYCYFCNLIQNFQPIEGIFQERWIRKIPHYSKKWPRPMFHEISINFNELVAFTFQAIMV